jgi:hypothetical protein
MGRDARKPPRASLVQHSRAVISGIAPRVAAAVGQRSDGAPRPVVGLTKIAEQMPAPELLSDDRLWRHAGSLLLRVSHVCPMVAMLGRSDHILWIRNAIGLRAPWDTSRHSLSAKIVTTSLSVPVAKVPRLRAQHVGHLVGSDRCLRGHGAYGTFVRCHPPRS